MNQHVFFFLFWTIHKYHNITSDLWAEQENRKFKKDTANRYECWYHDNDNMHEMKRWNIGWRTLTQPDAWGNDGSYHPGMTSMNYFIARSINKLRMCQRRSTVRSLPWWWSHWRYEYFTKHDIESRALRKVSLIRCSHCESLSVSFHGDNNDDQSDN